MPEQDLEAATTGRTEIVCFKIGQQDFCIEISHVLEIRGWTRTTVLPHAPDYVVGMMNLRGTVLPVIDQSMMTSFVGPEKANRKMGGPGPSS